MESDAKTELSMVTDTCMGEIKKKEKEIEYLKLAVESAQNELAGVRADL